MYSSRVLNAIADASREKRLSPKNAASGYQATQHLKNNLHNTRNKVISRYKRADAPQRLPRNHWRGPTAHSGNLGFNRKAPGCIVNPVFPIERPHQKLPVASCLINVRFWENQDQVPKTGHPPADTLSQNLVSFSSSHCYTTQRDLRRRPPCLSAMRVSFSEGDCTECQESAARPVGAIFCGSVPCAEQRQAMPLNRRCRMRRPCASLGHTTP